MTCGQHATEFHSGYACYPAARGDGGKAVQGVVAEQLTFRVMRRHLLTSTGGLHRVSDVDIPGFRPIALVGVAEAVANA